MTVTGTGTPATSPNFGAPRFSQGDAADFSDQVNAITDTFDAAAVKFTSDVLANIPTATNVGQRFYATDTKQEFWWNGTVWVASSSTLPLVTTLPSSAYDGQVVYFQPHVSAAGIVWQLRYNAGSSSTYKWEFIGGDPWHLDIGGGTASTGAGTPANTWELFGPVGGPSGAGNWQTLGRAGEYLVEFGCDLYANANAVYSTYVRPQPAGLFSYQISVSQVTGTGIEAQARAASCRQKITAPAATQLQYGMLINTAGEASVVEMAWISVRPFRVI